MNLMHEDIKITDEIYAPILTNEVQLRINRLAASEPGSMDNSLESLVRSLSNYDLSAVMRIVAEGWFYDAHALAQSFQTVYNAKQI